jgi:hypothetical protein
VQINNCVVMSIGWFTMALTHAAMDMPTVADHYKGSLLVMPA